MANFSTKLNYNALLQALGSAGGWGALPTSAPVDHPDPNIGEPSDDQKALVSESAQTKTIHMYSYPIQTLGTEVGTGAMSQKLPLPTSSPAPYSTYIMGSDAVTTVDPAAQIGKDVEYTKATIGEYADWTTYGSTLKTETDHTHCPNCNGTAFSVFLQPPTISQPPFLEIQCTTCYKTMVYDPSGNFFEKTNPLDNLSTP